jgi:hypothetical protein
MSEKEVTNDESQISQRVRGIQKPYHDDRATEKNTFEEASKTKR